MGNYCEYLQLVSIYIEVFYCLVGLAGFANIVGFTSLPSNPNCTLQANHTWSECEESTDTLFLNALTDMTVNGTDVFAVLHYAGAPDAEPTTPQLAGPPADEVFKEFNLEVLVLLISNCPFD